MPVNNSQDSTRANISQSFKGNLPLSTWQHGGACHWNIEFVAWPFETRVFIIWTLKNVHYFLMASGPCQHNQGSKLSSQVSVTFLSEVAWYLKLKQPSALCTVPTLIAWIYKSQYIKMMFEIGWKTKIIGKNVLCKLTVRQFWFLWNIMQHRRRNEYIKCIPDVTMLQ